MDRKRVVQVTLFLVLVAVFIAVVVDPRIENTTNVSYPDTSFIEQPLANPHIQLNKQRLPMTEVS